MKTWGKASFILFVVGLVVAIIGGVASIGSWVTPVLAALGVIIGAIYVSSTKDVSSLLLATIAILATAAALGSIPLLGGIVTKVVVNFAALMAPVALIAAVKALVQIGLDK
jgi:hypothetical protein